MKDEVESVERKGVLEAKCRELERLEIIKKLVYEQQVYEQSECSDEETEELLHQHVSQHDKQEIKHERTVQNSSPPQANTQPKQEDKTAALIRLFAESISTNHLPLPEPTTFSNDPLRFNDWKVSFQTLIDQTNIPDEEKDVSGPAKKAIESNFLLGTETTYQAAWTILQERYGNPFLITKVFRNKLKAWPKIMYKGSLELKEFADFLHSCEATMSQIKGLEVLNNYNENQKILAKLPDCLTS